MSNRMKRKGSDDASVNSSSDCNRRGRRYNYSHRKSYSFDSKTSSKSSSDSSSNSIDQPTRINSKLKQALSKIGYF